ncbi:MAG TPA: glycosyltransferase family 39 protein, partial [Humisphaera sp.]
MSGRWLVGWWLAAGAALLALIGAPPVTRTQEARVLETAREMLGRPADEWVVPRLNGGLRVRKPPLTYWMAAAAFAVGGVGEGVGRVPTAACGWLLVGVTFAAADRLVGRRAAFLSAAGLATSYLFFRHARLAETDAPAALFATAAAYAFLRAADTGRAGWYHAAAAGVGLAFNAKGLPGLFPVAVSLAWAAVDRRWDVPRRFVTSGAVVTAAVLSGAWYAYAAARVGPAQFAHELRKIATGEGHAGAFYLYVPRLLAAAAPWPALLVAGVAAAAARWRSDHGLRRAAVWFATIFLLLCAVPNRQFHYLFPALPPAMILAGWAASAAVGGVGNAADAAVRLARVAAGATAVGLVVAAVAGVP